MRSWGGLGRSWGVSWAVLHRSGAVFLGSLGRFGVVLGSFCRIKSITGQQRDARATKGSKDKQIETKISKEKQKHEEQETEIGTYASPNVARFPFLLGKVFRNVRVCVR